MFSLLIGFILLHATWCSPIDVILNSTELLNRPECNESTILDISYYRPTNVSERYIECRSLGLGLEKECLNGTVFSQEVSCCVESDSVKVDIPEFDSKIFIIHDDSVKDQQLRDTNAIENITVLDDGTFQVDNSSIRVGDGMNITMFNTTFDNTTWVVESDEPVSIPEEPVQIGKRYVEVIGPFRDQFNKTDMIWVESIGFISKVNFFDLQNITSFNVSTAVDDGPVNITDFNVTSINSNSTFEVPIVNLVD